MLHLLLLYLIIRYKVHYTISFMLRKISICREFHHRSTICHFAAYGYSLYVGSCDFPQTISRRAHHIIRFVLSSLAFFFSFFLSRPLLDKMSLRLIDHSESVVSYRETFPTTCRFIVTTLTRWQWYKVSLCKYHITFLPKYIFKSTMHP